MSQSPSRVRLLSYSRSSLLSSAPSFACFPRHAVADLSPPLTAVDRAQSTTTRSSPPTGRRSRTSTFVGRPSTVHAPTQELELTTSLVPLVDPPRVAIYRGPCRCCRGRRSSSLAETRSSSTSSYVLIPLIHRRRNQRGRRWSATSTELVQSDSRRGPPRTRSAQEAW